MINIQSETNDIATNSSAAQNQKLIPNAIEQRPQNTHTQRWNARTQREKRSKKIKFNCPNVNDEIELMS